MTCSSSLVRDSQGEKGDRSMLNAVNGLNSHGFALLVSCSLGSISDKISNGGPDDTRRVSVPYNVTGLPEKADGFLAAGNESVNALLFEHYLLSWETNQS